MIDSVIAGTGNSRFLRTSISASTTWEDALTMLRAGTFPIDLAGINIDGYITVGTPLNSETLLKEAVITALDLDDSATPSDAWEKLIAIVNTKADADSVVTAITYDSAEKKLYATIDGTPTLVTTFDFTTPQEAADAAPVQSVAGRTGDVTLSASDVSYATGSAYPDNTVGKALEDDDARMGEIEGDISEIQGDISDIQGDISDINGEIDGIGEDITGIRGDISDINGDITGIRGDIGDIQTDITGIKGDIRDIQADTSGIHGDITAIQGDITDIKGDIRDIEGDVSTLQGNMTDAQSAITALQGDVTDIQGDITDIQGDITDIGEDITGINTELDAFEQNVEENYARVDGYYEEMTVGNAEQLVATVGIDDNAPYLFRTTGGSADVGDRKTMELVGGTVAWNQLIKAINTDNFRVIGTGATISDNLISINGNVTIAERWTIPACSGHVYYLTFDYKNTLVGNSKVWFYLNNPSMAFNIPSSTNFARFDKLVTIGVGRDNSVNFITDSYESGELDIKNFMLIDLTQMFGSTIAGYVYSIEQAHVGDGVAWFKRLFPKDYYAYNVGELMSVKTSAQNTIGFNQWDEEWERGSISSQTGQPIGDNSMIRTKNFIPVVPSTTYFFKVPYNIGLARYDANKNFISLGSVVANSLYTTPASCHYLKFYVVPSYGNVYQHDICVNLSWDGERDGEYEPYDVHNYPLDSDLELRGIPKLNENNELYYDGDMYQSDGTVTRKYGVVDLGTLYWRKDQANNGFYAQPGTGAMLAKGGVIPNAICPAYMAARYDQVKGKSYSKCYNIATTTHYIYLYDASNEDTTAEDFKTLMSGVYMVYELETPSSESADSFTSPEAVDDFGTEQFVDTRDVPLPVGHNSQYQANLRAKLEMAPDSPDGDGDYLVRQSNGTNAYVPYIVPTAGDVNFDASAEYDDGTVGAELNRKAYIDGYYEEMTVGNAEQLVATVGVDDSVPYVFRTTGGNADVGDRKEMEIVGGTISWNQLTHDTEASNTKSGDIVEVDDAKEVPFESLKVRFEPVQDLHGYDKPWPAGGGVNRLPPTNSETKTRTQNGMTCVANDNGTFAFSGATSGGSFDQIFTLPQTYVIADGDYIHVGNTITSSSAMMFLTFTDDTNINNYFSTLNKITSLSEYVGKTIKSLRFFFADGVAINDTFTPMICNDSVAKPFAPYENVCYISGFTGANIEHTGESLSDRIGSVPYKQDTGLWIFLKAGSYTAQISTCSLENWRWLIVPRKTLDGTNDASLVDANDYVMYKSGNNNWYSSGQVTRLYQNFNVLEDAYVQISISKGSGTTGEGTITEPMLTKGIHDSVTYVPYSGETIPVSWQSEVGEVFKGYYDLVSGKLMATGITIDLKTLSFTMAGRNTSGVYFYKNNYNVPLPISDPPHISYSSSAEKYSHGTIANPWSEIGNYAWAYRGSATMRTIRVGFSNEMGIDSVEKLNEWASAQSEWQLYYDLLEPIEYTLTPTEVTALLGTNVAWNNIGTTELTYKSEYEHHTLATGRKYFTQIDGVGSIVTGDGQEVVAKCGRDNVHDLSLMLGSTIASYLGNITASDAVSWFRRLFPKTHYTYDAGSLQSVQTSANVCVGFNQLNLNRSTIVNTGIYDRSARREFSEDQVWLGLTNNNYFSPSKITRYSIERESVTVNTTAAGYGVGFPIKVVPNTTYSFSTDEANAIGFGFYDANGNWLSDTARTVETGTFITPNDCYWLAVIMRPHTLNTDVVYAHPNINLSWDGERDGEYEEYVARTYPLDSDLVLRGIPQLSGDNSLHYDGDTYESDGTVTRRYGVVTLDGTETYNVSNAGYIRSDACDAWVYYAPLGNIPFTVAAQYARCNMLAVAQTSGVWSATGFANYFTINGGNGSKQIHINIANELLGITNYRYETQDTARAKIAAYVKSLYDAGTPLQFVVLVNEETTETADPYQTPQIIDDFGTEEFVDAGVTADPPTRDVAIPVGHNTVYAANLRAKLEMAPDSPDGDGDYIVRQTNGENAYVLLEKELPAAPTANGTYVLKVVINNGTATYSWEAQT